MDTSQFALIGTGIGTLVGAAYLAWIKLVMPAIQSSVTPAVQKSVAESAVPTAEFQKLRDAVQLLQNLEKTLDEIKANLKALDERLRRCVTDEEFAAYTAQSTAHINGLTEKVGRATGVLEAWTARRT
jgi:hypothetical protein